MNTDLLPCPAARALAPLVPLAPQRLTLERRASRPAWLRLRPLLQLACALALLGSALLGSAYAAPGAHGPDGEHLATPAAHTRSGDALARLPAGSVQVPMRTQRLLGLRTELAQPRSVALSTLLPARVLADPNASARVQSALAGTFEAAPGGVPVAGQTVRRGQLLGWVRSQPDPASAAALQAQGAELRAALALAQQRAQRLSQLEGSVPGREIEAAHADVQGMQARAAALAAGLGARQALHAPMNGVLAQAEVVPGQAVEGRDVLFEIIDPQRLLVQAQAADAALAERIAAAYVLGLDGVRLHYLGAARVLRDGLVAYHFRASSSTPGAGLPLAIGQPLQLVLQLRQQVQGYVLPAQAVVRNPANQPVLWIKAGAERYLAQVVQFQPLDAQRVLVTGGLGPDNRVVVQGAAQLAQIR